MKEDFRLKNIARTLGDKEITYQLAEECSELTQAIIKSRRAVLGLTPKTEEECWENVIEEMADVAVCIDAYNVITGVLGDENSMSKKGSRSILEIAMLCSKLSTHIICNNINECTYKDLLFEINELVVEICNSFSSILCCESDATRFEKIRQQKTDRWYKRVGDIEGGAKYVLQKDVQARIHR